MQDERDGWAQDEELESNEGEGPRRPHVARWLMDKSSSDSHPSRRWCWHNPTPDPFVQFWLGSKVRNPSWMGHIPMLSQQASVAHMVGLP